MLRFIVTGAPGSGKTAIIRQLELDGFSVVEEAATDLIAARHAVGIMEPWKDPSFLDQITALQRDRQLRASTQPDRIQFHDRSPVCTAALADYLGYPVSAFLAAELERIANDAVFQKKTFFIRNLGFIANTDARRITFEETLRFEKIHEEAYRKFNFEPVFIEAASLQDRVMKIKSIIGTPRPPHP